jgi:hypothetical protein
LLGLEVGLKHRGARLRHRGAHPHDIGRFSAPALLMTAPFYKFVDQSPKQRLAIVVGDPFAASSVPGLRFRAAQTSINFLCPTFDPPLFDSINRENQNYDTDKTIRHN